MNKTLEKLIISATLPLEAAPPAIHIFCFNFEAYNAPRPKHQISAKPGKAWLSCWRFKKFLFAF